MRFHQSFIYYRFGTMLTVIVISLKWKLGALITTLCICFLIFVIPVLATVYNKHASYSTSLSARTVLFIPVYIENKLSENENVYQEKAMKTRRKNKVVCLLMIVLIGILQFVFLDEILELFATDTW